MTLKRLLFLWLPAVLWCGIIFTFSSIPMLPKVSFVWWDFILKKTAHISEYAILFFLIWRAVTGSFKTNRAFWLSFVLGLLYAVSDEFHQSFVSGRTSTIRDVGFDAFGLLLSWQLIKRRRAKSNQQTFTTASASQTKELAKRILPQLSGRNIVCLYGDLGSGKTTFVQGLAEALGIKGNAQSPTFQLVREYDREIKNQSRLGGTKIKKLIHVDCYRIESEQDLKGVDLQEYWQDKKNLVVIEWAERVEDILPKDRVDVCFERTGTNTRKITLFIHC